MTISSLTPLLYPTPLSTQSSAMGASSASAASAASIGDQLLAAFEQSPVALTSSNSLLQELVSLSPAALGQSNTTPQTYTAQGLLQQMQSSMLLNDPLLQPDATDTANPISNSLLGSLTSFPQIPASAVGTAGATQPSPGATNGTGKPSSTQTPSTAGANGTADPNANWAQLLKNDPALANVLVQSQLEQGVISMLA